MKKWMIVAAVLALAVPACLGNAVEREEGVKAAYVCEAESGTAVAVQRETERLPIASMCKIMTLLLAFEAADAGELSLEESVVVS